MGKIWEIASDTVSTQDNPERILKKYADLLKDDTDGKFVGVVTESVSEDTGVATFALYILVPELKDYMYRLIEVGVQDLATPYPVEIRLLAKDPKNQRAFAVSNPTDYKAKLESLIASPVTKSILAHLKTLIDIKNDYRQP
jgi:hypothetical protein